MAAQDLTAGTLIRVGGKRARVVTVESYGAGKYVRVRCASGSGRMAWTLYLPADAPMTIVE